MNHNHPQKGDSIKVDPIRSLADIQRIKSELSTRDKCLFTLGINTNLRASDLTAISLHQIQGDELVLKEKKTGKERRITLNKSCLVAIRELVKEESLNQCDLLFRSRKGGGKLTVPTINRLVKTWCHGLPGNYGSHSLRKTFGYHQRVTFNVDVATLMTVFNHATQRQTLDYLCVQPDEIKSVYLNEL